MLAKDVSKCLSLNQAKQINNIAGENAKWYKHLGKHSGNPLKKKKKLPLNSAVPLLGILPREIKTYTH